MARRPVKKPASVAPPPPAVIKREPAADLTQTFSPVVMPLSPLPALPPLAPPPARRALTTGAQAGLPPPGAKASSFARLVRHARPAELALAAALAVLFTWTVSALSHRSQLTSAANQPRALRPTAPAEEPSCATSAENAETFGPGSSIPVVSIADLPVEGQSAARGTSAPSATPRLNSMRAELARALGNAARAAQSCGVGPVNTQIVATFAASGVARAIHFGANAPPPALRSCVLNAVARAHISPFEGEPVTVSKTIRW